MDRKIIKDDCYSSFAAWSLIPPLFNEICLVLSLPARAGLVGIS